MGLKDGKRNKKRDDLATTPPAAVAASGGVAEQEVHDAPVTPPAAVAASGGVAEQQPRGELCYIPLDAVSVPEHPLRRLASEELMDSLRSSIRARGVLQPVIVRRQGKRYELVAGLRRVMCARSVGLATIPAVVVRADEEWALWARVAENRLREAVNPLDMAQHLQREMLRTGLNEAQMAKILQVSS